MSLWKPRYDEYTFGLISAVITMFDRFIKTADGDAYVANIPMIGVTKEDVHVTTRDGLVKIKAKADFEGETYSYNLDLFVPKDADSSKLVAKLDRGILALRVPMLEQSLPREIKIE